MNNKKISRDVMWFAEQMDVVTLENFGGRKNHQAIELVTVQRLLLDIVRYQGYAVVIASTDAKGCFD